MSYTVDCRSAAASLLLKSALGSLGELYVLTTSDVTSAFQQLCIPLNIKEFATFIALTHQCLSVAPYALLYNKHVVDAIRKHSYDVLRNMYKRGKLDVPEIFNNDKLTPGDIKVISDLLELDIQAIIMYIENYNPDMDTQVYNKEVEYMSSDSEEVYLYSENSSFLQKCRNAICYREKKPHIPIGQETKIYTSVQEYGKIMSTITCIDLRKALYMAATNPRMLNTDLLKSVERTYYKEIAIYKYSISRGYVLPPSIA